LRTRGFAINFIIDEHARRHVYSNEPCGKGPDTSNETDVALRELWKSTKREMLSLDGVADGLIAYPYVFAPHVVGHWLIGVDPFFRSEEWLP
jgi:hypothetical protein